MPMASQIVTFQIQTAVLSAYERDERILQALERERRALRYRFLYEEWASEAQNFALLSAVFKSRHCPQSGH